MTVTVSIVRFRSASGICQSRKFGAYASGRVGLILGEVGPGPSRCWVNVDGPSGLGRAAGDGEFRCVTQTGLLGREPGCQWQWAQQGPGLVTICHLPLKKAFVSRRPSLPSDIQYAERVRVTEVPDFKFNRNLKAACHRLARTTGTGSDSDPAVGLTVGKGA